MRSFLVVFQEARRMIEGESVAQRDVEFALAYAFKAIEGPSNSQANLEDC